MLAKRYRGKDRWRNFSGSMELQYLSLLQYPINSVGIKGSRLDGTEVTDTTEGISISADES
ncbi:MAG: hypothetical protein ACLRYY_06365 [Anaerobutyricum soehngenii]